MSSFSSDKVKKFVMRNLQAVRRQAGLSQEAFGKLFGLTRGQVASYELGDAEPNISALMNICEYFSLDLSVFLTGDVATVAPQKASQLKEPEAQYEHKYSYEIAELKKRIEKIEHILQALVKKHGLN